MADAAALLRQFQDVTNGFMKQNESSGTVKLLRSTVKTLEAITKKIDAFLKTKNVDVGERLEQLSGKTKDAKKSLTSLFNTTKADIKANGLKGFLANKAEDVRSTLTEKFTSDTEGGTAPPETTNSVLSRLQESIDKLTDKVQSVGGGAMAGGGSIDPVSSSKSTGLDRYRASIDKASARAARRAKEVEEEKNAVRAGMKKPKGKTNWLGKILGGITKLGGFIVGGFGKIALRLIPGIGKMTGWAMGKVLGRFVPALSKGIARATGGLVKKGAGLLGRGVMAAGRMAIPALIGGAKAVGGAIAGALGATGLAVAGVVVGAGLLIYGGYKLYKYLNRNNIDTDIFGKLTRLRLLMYGLNDSNKEHYYRVLELEMMMKDYVQYKDGVVSFTKLTKKIKDKVLDLFEVKYEEKEKYTILNTWFVKRFMPGLKGFLDALMPTKPNIYLDTIDKLTPDQVFEMTSKLIVPVSVFDIKQIPAFDNPTSLVAKQEVDDMLISIRTQAKANSKALEGKDPTKLAQDNSKASQKSEVTAAAKATQITQAGKPTVVADINAAINNKIDPGMGMTPSGPSAALPNANKPATETPNQEGEGKVPDTAGKPPEGQSPGNTTNPGGKLTVAPGNLQPGDKSLQGISIGPNGNRDRLGQLDPMVFNLFTGMAKEFNSLTGKNITVNESFRSYQDQMALRQKYPTKAAKPGNSVHEYGMALDINSPEADLLDKMGLMRKYGFTRPVGGETWHIEPAGVALNPNLAKSNMEARRKAITSSPGRGGGGYGSTKSTPLGKRNQPLQQKLYNEGDAETADLSSLDKKDVTTAAGPGTPVAGGNPPPKATAAPSPASPTNTTSPDQATVAQSKQTSDKTYGGTAGSGGSSAGLASASTKDSMTKTDPTITAGKGLDPTGKGSNSNLDPGAIGSKNLSPVQAIEKAAGVVGMEPSTMVTYAKVESSLNPQAGAKTSSAKGLFQITKPTWGGLVNKQGRQYGVPPDADIFDPYYNSLMGISYAKENAASTLPLGRKAGLPDEISLYLAHHFGPSGSSRIINAYMSNPNQAVKDAVSASTFSANQKELSGKTIAQYIDHLKAKMSNAANTPASAYSGGKGTSSSSGSASTASSSASGATSSAASSAPSSSTITTQATNTAGYGTTPPTPPSPSASTAPVRTEPMPQPTMTQGLDKSSEILNNQLNTLIDIRTILNQIAGNGALARPALSQGNTAPAPNAPAAPTQLEASAPAPKLEVAGGTASRAPSTTGISLSRRPIV